MERVGGEWEVSFSLSPIYAAYIGDSSSPITADHCFSFNSDDPKTRSFRLADPATQHNIMMYNNKNRSLFSSSVPEINCHWHGDECSCGVATTNVSNSMTKTVIKAFFVSKIQKTISTANRYFGLQIQFITIFF